MYRILAGSEPFDNSSLENFSMLANQSMTDKCKMIRITFSDSPGASSNSFRDIVDAM